MFNATHETAATDLGPVLLVGCGKMGQSLLCGWIERGLGDIRIVSPHTQPTGDLGTRATVHRDVETIPEGFSPTVVVFAVKPQQALEAIPGYMRFCTGDTVFLSIMAGKSVADIQTALGGTASVVRAMPNTPASIRRGFTCAFAGPTVTPRQRGLCDTLLSAVGEVAWVENEDLIHPITAISGGGPAYVFLLAELLEAAAVGEGLPPDLARRMARSIISGSGALLAGTEIDATKLRADVTSPGGTTECALDVLMASDAWPKLLREAMSAATQRSRALSAR